MGGRPCRVIAKVLNSDFEVSEFELQLCIYIHIWTNTPLERYEPPDP